MTSIWFPNNKYPPNTKNYLPCFVLGGGFSIRRKGLIYIYNHIYIYVYKYRISQGIMRYYEDFGDIGYLFF